MNTRMMFVQAVAGAAMLCLAGCACARQKEMDSLVGKNRKEVLVVMYERWVDSWRPISFKIDLYCNGDGRDPRSVYPRWGLQVVGVNEDWPGVENLDAILAKDERAMEAYCWQFYDVCRTDWLGRQYVPTFWFDSKGVVTNFEEVIYVSK